MGSSPISDSKQITMKQQTALDFYIDKMNEWFKDACVHCELSKEDNEIYQQAKQMEKEQIIDCLRYAIQEEYYNRTWANCQSTSIAAEQYYNEAYKK